MSLKLVGRINWTMKIKTISRNEEDFTRATKLDIQKLHRNRDPRLHPFEQAREYTRAVAATKIERMFAKPFVGSLDGHMDGVYCTSTVRNRLAPFISGACDGEIRVWDLSHKTCVWSSYGHSGFVRGLAVDPEGKTFFSCGDDKIIKRWNLEVASDRTEQPDALSTYMAPHVLTAIDHHWADNIFATSGEAVNLWDHTRSEPISTYTWGVDAVNCVRFNPAERCLLGSTGSDRGVVLYDVRSPNPMRKAVLQMKSNKIEWNPREPLNFVLANEDNNLYTFDMRNLDKALMIHKDHVSAVMDVAFSPTGREFVSASYDRTIRIFKVNKGHSRELYHTRRMGRAFCINVSQDAQFVLSGSDDMNIRLWKMQASKAVGKQASRVERKQQYTETLKKRYQHMPEVKRIAKHRHAPRTIKKQQAIRHIQTDSQRRKYDNRKRHSKPGTVEEEPERKRAVVRELT